MIVREDGDGLVQGLSIVRQADHAQLSGRLASAWGRPPWQPVEPFPSVAVAARHHDDAWLTYDDAPEVRDGRPLSFFEVDRVKTTAMYSAGIRAVTELDAYAGLLVSLHYSGFFTSHWGWQPLSTPERFREPEAGALRRFLDEQAAHQAKLRKRLRVGRAGEVRLAANYMWLQLWDRVSLDICRQSAELPWAVEYPEVPVGYTGTQRAGLKLAMIAPGRYTLNPYPFLPAHFGATIPVARVAAGQPSADSFLAAWRSASTETARVSIEAAPA